MVVRNANMSEAGDYDYGEEDRETTDFIKVIKDNKVVEVEYCLYCGSTNIKTSKKGNQYCGEICWTKHED